LLVRRTEVLKGFEEKAKRTIRNKRPAEFKSVQMALGSGHAWKLRAADGDWIEYGS
jgi:hypothetical protein